MRRPVVTSSPSPPFDPAFLQLSSAQALLVDAGEWFSLLAAVSRRQHVLP